jgi:hypothetical protein
MQGASQLSEVQRHGRKFQEEKVQHLKRQWDEKQIKVSGSP